MICTRCIYSSDIPGISFDSKGVCNYCHQIDALKQEFGTGTAQGTSKLNSLIDDMKRGGKGRRYDCVVGVSGGTDSSHY